MKRVERERMLRHIYRSIITALTLVCFFLGGVLIIHEMARQNELKNMQAKLDAKGVVENEEGLKVPIQLFLPKEIYVASGVTIEIYNSQISSIGEKISNYNVKWTCAVGKNMKKKFSITGTEELLGNYPLIFTVFDDNGTQVATASTKLKIVKARTDSFSLLTIGDSLSCHTATYERLNELTDNAIVYMGTRGVGGSLTEARRGFSAKNYCEAAPYEMEEPFEEVHPFYNPETESFDWDYYKTTTGFQPDAIQLFLGTNGLALDPKENGDYIVQMVKEIHKTEPDLPIYLVHTLYSANQDGIGSWNNKGYALYGDRYKYEEDQKVFALMLYLEEQLENEEQLYFVPAGICHDSEHNFEMQEVPVNPHSEETIEVPIDAVHPGRAGYEQVADCLYSVICGTKEEWSE